MSGKLTIRCVGWRPLRKNSQCGIATIRIVETRMTLHGVAVHARNGKAWASPPARPWVKDGRVVLGEDGRPQYSQLVEFDTPAVRTAWSDAVIRAVIAFDAHALESGAAA